MEAKHKQFIRRKLIPFILREHGRGFAMSTWIDKDNVPGTETDEDGVIRAIPSCGTIACIGGSACVLQGKPVHADRIAQRALGLTSRQANALLYHWEPEDITEGNILRWPTKFIRAFAQRKTAWGKARVAAALLKEVMRTNGKCLEQADGN